MKPPAKLDVGPHTFTVTVDRDTGRQLRSYDTLGDTVISSLRIRIDDDLEPSVQRETMLHEALHALWWLTALPSNDLCDHDEEAVVKGLAAPLLDLLRRNPSLVEFLTA